MKRLAGWIKHHQVASFFVMAYAISWPLLIIYYTVFHGDRSVGALLEPLVVFSPALAAMLISGIAEPLPKHVGGRSRWIALVLAWLVSAPILILYAWRIYGVEPAVAAVVYGVIALFPAWVLSSAYARTPGIRKQFSTLVRPRGPAVWYLVVFLIFPGVPLLAAGITRLLGGEAEFYLADLGLAGAAVILLLEFLHGFLLTGGINEESGWRGFALPRLQARYPVIVAAAIVWFFWALWHLPFDIGSGTPIAAILENRLMWNLIFSILMAWLYNRTNGSILAPALFHTAMNAVGNQFSMTAAGRVLFIGLALLAIVSDRMWKKLPPDHPAADREPALDSGSALARPIQA